MNLEMRRCFQFFSWNPCNWLVNKNKPRSREKVFPLWFFWLEIWDGQFRQDSWLAVENFLPFLQLFDCQNDESFFWKVCSSFKAFFRQNLNIWCKYYSTWSNFRFWATRLSTRLSDQLDLRREEHFEEIYFFQKKQKIFRFWRKLSNFFGRKFGHYLRNISAGFLIEFFLRVQINNIGRKRCVFRNSSMLLSFSAFEQIF